MAYDSLKALIRQYIKTNGEEEITGQILQNVLVEMVNQYPSTDGYATQSWVTSQGYATTSQLAGYLPLTGGTLSGNLTVSNAYMSVVTADSSNTSYTTIIRGPGIEAQMMSSGTPIYRMVLDYGGLTFYNNDVAGTTITRSSITSGSFIKSGGTAAQFLKADGSVDSNTYVTSSVLSGYLPLTGGTLQGVLYFADEDGQAVRGEIFGDEFGLSIQVAGYGILSIENKIETDNTIKTEGFIKRGGTSAQFLKADGSVDSNTYLTSASLADYLPLTGGTITGNLTVNGTGYFSNTFTVQSIELGHSNEINSLSDGLYNLHLNYRVSGNVSICYGGGNCGIGTNNPSYKLDVNGSANATTLYENGTSLSSKYLALTGGTLTGDLFFSSNGINRGEIFGDEYGLNIQVSGQGKLLIENAIEADSTIKTAGFIKSGGTSAQFLKADGSVTTLKTINGNSLEGSGDIVISGGGYDAEVEYLKSTGTQWIDTGIAISSNLDFELVASIDSNIANLDIVAGGRNNNRNEGRFLFLSLYNSSNIIRTTYGATDLTTGYTLGTKVTVKKSDLIAYLNGSQWGTFANSFDNSNQQNVCIFTGSGYETITEWASSCKVYSLKLYNSGTLIRDFIPVRVGNVGYMYDKVSGQLFGNSGTGSFVLGPDKEYLPLTGGTLTGALNIDKGASSIILDFGGIRLDYGGADFKIYADHNFITNKNSLIITNLVENTIGTIDIRHNKLSVDNSITATSFIKSGGTSAQFLKADGSVTTLKTINGNSLEGSGNIVISGGGGAPYDAEIEYLKSTGTQWIDTGIVASQTIDFEITGSINNNVTNADTAAGGRNNNSDNGRFLFFSLSSSSNEIRTVYSLSTLTSNYTLGTKVNIKKIGSEVFLNNSKWGDFTATLDESNPKSIYIFSTNGYPSPTSYSAYCTIYSLKIYNNGTLVRNFIPVRKNGIGYMYDKVSGQLFGNSGTGSFVLGADKEYLPLTGGTITGNLTIKNSSSSFSTWYIIDGEGSYTHRIVADGDGLNIYSGNDFYFNAVGDFYFVNRSVAVGTYATSYKLTVGGQVGATGFVNTSDLNKKNIMGDVPMNLYNVANAPLFKFTWNDEKEYSGQHIGSAAQYWQTVLPELVSIGRDADLTLAMQYDVIALASAITVAKTVVNHEERIILLERENEALKKEIADLKSA